MSKWVVRRAKASDFTWSVEQASTFLGTLDIGVPVDPAHMAHLFHKFVTDPAFYLLIATCDGEPRGQVAAIVQPHFFNPSVKVFTELMWWVPVEHRSSRAGLVLLDALDKVGSSVADLVSLSLEASSRVNERHLEKRGFSMQERGFIKQVGK